MLRPYGPPASTRQLGARQGFGLLDVGLVESVHPKTAAQLIGGVLPRQELGTEDERIGGEVAHDLAVGRRRRDRAVHHREEAWSVLPVALRPDLLDQAGRA